MQGALKRVTIKEYRCFTEGETYDFLPHINLLVGDQGSGKSTLLTGLRDSAHWIDIELSEQCLREGTDSFYFDTESMNPRIVQSVEHLSSNQGLNAVLSRFTSHGETLKSLVLDPLKNPQPAVVFLDEPEAGLSLRSQSELFRLIEAATNCQFFIATHSYVLISKIKKVLSLEHKKWVDNYEFLKTQL